MDVSSGLSSSPPACVRLVVVLLLLGLFIFYLFIYACACVKPFRFAGA